MSKSKKDNQTVSLTNDVTIDLDNDPYYAKDGVFSVTLDDPVVDPIQIDSSDDYILTFDDTITIGDGTNYVTTNSSEWFTGNDTITVNLNDDPTYTFNSWPGYELWKDCLPSIADVEGMCKEYPALEKAFENFKTIYKMVEQDYKGKKEDDS